jgi:hypothetical protein
MEEIDAATAAPFAVQTPASRIPEPTNIATIDVVSHPEEQQTANSRRPVVRVGRPTRHLELRPRPGFTAVLRLGLRGRRQDPV